MNRSRYTPACWPLFCAAVNVLIFSVLLCFHARRLWLILFGLMACCCLFSFAVTVADLSRLQEPDTLEDALKRLRKI